MNAPATLGDSAERNMAGRQLGRYEVLTQLASGGMAAVYVARAQGVAGFERLVAIKVLHPHLAYEEDFISMFLDEARLAARIRHPNVVPTLDISDSQGDGYFLVMEYIEGDHLGALLGRSARQGERLPRPFVCRGVVDALQGLGAAHRLKDENGSALNLVHRDISPHNILFGTDGIARLTDFGVAKAEVRMASTRAGQFKGKLAYMAPEQASAGTTDQRSDLFSMGIILWESLTGRRLFKGENNAATLKKILSDPIPKPSALWEDLVPYDELVLKALDREPESRFQSADEFVEAIENVAGRTGIANARDAAEFVKDLASEKLKRETARIKVSIEQLGRAEIGEAAMPLPREDLSFSRARPPAHNSLTPSAYSLPPMPPQRETKALWALVLMLSFLVILGGGWLVLRVTGDGQAIVRPPTATAPAKSAPTPVRAASPKPEGKAQKKDSEATDKAVTDDDYENALLEALEAKAALEAATAAQAEELAAAQRETAEARAAAQREAEAAKARRRRVRKRTTSDGDSMPKAPDSRPKRSTPTDIDLDNPYLR